MLFQRKKNNPKNRVRRQINGVPSRPQAFSYHAKRTDQQVTFGRQQPREQDNRKQARILRQLSQRFGLVLVALVLMVCLVDVLHLSKTPKIVSLTSSSNNAFLQAEAVYAQAATKQFDSSIFNANKVTIHTSAIEASLKHDFPELADVSITLPLISHRPIVYISPTSPGLILTTTKGSFVIDENGKALLSTDKVADSAKLQVPTVLDLSDLQVHTGSAALPSTSVSFIKTVKAELTAKGVGVATFTLPATPYELDIKPTGANYIVKFNLHASSEVMEQVGSYLAVKQRLAGQGITPSNYIDVRVSGRAYYK